MKIFKLKMGVKENKRNNTLFDSEVPLNPIFFEVSNIILKDFQEKNPVFFRNKGISSEYYCSILNEQIVLFQQAGITEWCGYAKDYLINLNKVREND